MKNESKFIFVLILILSTFLGGLGQFMFKLGLNSANFFVLYMLVALGFVLYALSTLFYFFVLSRASLTWVYSFGGLSYIFASFFAFFILNEPISLMRWMGIFVIAIGTVFVGLS
ncbi:MAG: hypothetical protein ACP5RT_00260 [Candidatus Micrarchaeia archaeon]